MKKLFIIIIVFLCGDISLFAQIANPDSTIVTLLKEVVVSANKLPVSLKHYPGSISLVSKATLSMMPRTIAINEALRLVPGVRIANQYDAERVHISIRGQGILTENGLRGIGVIVDGIPLNDPSGFVPDLYGIDGLLFKTLKFFGGPLQVCMVGATMLASCTLQLKMAEASLLAVMLVKLSGVTLLPKRFSR